MPRRTAKTMRRRVKSASKKMAQSVRMRRGAPAKKKTQKAKKSGNDWYKQVAAVFKEMRQKDPNVQLKDAMKEASRRKKKGLLLSPVQSAASSEFSIVSAPKKKKALSPVQNVASSEFSTVSAPKPKKKAKKKALSDLGPRPAKTASGKNRGYNSEGATRFIVGPFPAPNPKKKAKKTKKKKMTPPPIPKNKKGKKIASKKKSSNKKWGKQYNSDGEVDFNNPLNSDYLSTGTE